MSKFTFIIILSILGLKTKVFSQPYVVNEKVEKIFSEGFTDLNDNFESTPKSDQKFWGKYADGYYYMERKIASPRAIVVKTEEVSKNFSIKTKLTLGPIGGTKASVGVMFLVQSSGRGGFIFEINKKKSFRITDLGTSAFITKEGKNGWLKSKTIALPSRSNTIELKSFRGKFDIYINGLYLYSFVNESYKKGKFGVYIGPNAAASLYYFNVYNLDIPSAEPEINIEGLQFQINSLKIENDRLKTLTLNAKYGDNDEAAISAIKILEDQLKTVNEENLHLKTILKDYEDSEPTLNLEEIEKDQKQTILHSEKMTKLSFERDSVIQSTIPLRNRILKSDFARDSLRDINLKLVKKITFLEEHIKEVQINIDEIIVDKKEQAEVIVQTNQLENEIIEFIIPKDSLENEQQEFITPKEKLEKEQAEVIVQTNQPENEIIEFIIPKDSLENKQQEFITPKEKLEKEQIEVDIPNDLTEKEQTEVISQPIQLKNEFDDLTVQINKSKKEPSTPSVIAIVPKLPESLPMGATAPPLELIEKDSTFDHTLDMDAAFGGDENTDTLSENISPKETSTNDSTAVLKEEINSAIKKITKNKETSKDSIIPVILDSTKWVSPKKKIDLTPIRELKIEIKKAIKGN